jgi:hypothetical protein
VLFRSGGGRMDKRSAPQDPHNGVPPIGGTLTAGEPLERRPAFLLAKCPAGARFKCRPAAAEYT